MGSNDGLYFICNQFNNSVSKSDNQRRLIQRLAKNELKMMLKKAMVAEFEALFRKLRGKLDGNRENPQSR